MAASAQPIALDRVLDGDDPLLADGLAAHPERLLEHRVDLALGLRPGRDAVELHDHAVLGGIVGHGVADGGGHASRRASRWSWPRRRSGSGRRA